MVRRTGSTGRANLEQVAALAGVSRATVSRVVNGVGTVAPALRERVEHAIAKLDYVPNRAARSLVTRRTDVVALVVAEPETRIFGDPFFRDIVRGVGQELGEAGLQLTLTMAESYRELDRVERYLRSAPIDGVLLLSEHVDPDPLPAAMVAAGVPLVIGGRPLRPDAAVPYVDNDNADGARQAALHLLARGRRVVGTVAGPPDMSAGIDRLAGFTAALGNAFRPERVERGAFTTESGEEATARLLARVPGLDGLFVANDLMALGALRALRSVGRRVPDDVAVVGFDDVPLAALSDPPLTTVRQQTVLQGRLMARMLLCRARPDLRLAHEDDVPEVRGVEAVVLPVALVVRGSS
jgi:DNA-binding LacI/PurR family transcriptional regulator